MAPVPGVVFLKATIHVSSYLRTVVGAVDGLIKALGGLTSMTTAWTSFPLPSDSWDILQSVHTGSYTLLFSMALFPVAPLLHLKHPVIFWKPRPYARNSVSTGYLYGVMIFESDGRSLELTPRKCVCVLFCIVS